MATAETRLELPQYYVWWFPGSPVKVHLALDVVRRLKHRLSESGAAISEEGLLFGGTRDGATEILDFQPATNSTVAELVEGLTLEKQRGLIGYYRTEEAETFQLNAQDAALAKEFFAKPNHVFLIVHANRFGPPTATFFFHDRDYRMADFAFLEFPFDPSLLAAEQSDRIQRSQQAIDGPIAVQPPVAASVAPVEVRRPKRRRFLRALAWTCALAVVFTLAMLFHNGSLQTWYSHWRANWNQRASANTPSEDASPLSVTVPVSHPTLSLRATRREGDLELTWNRDSALIASATSGTLSIQDGDSTRQVSFDAAQLRDGSLVYLPKTDQILMRLTVTTPTSTAAESVMVILPTVGKPQTYTMVPAATQPKNSPITATVPPAPPSEITSPSRPFTPPVSRTGNPSRDVSVLQDPPPVNSQPGAVPAAGIMERLPSLGGGGNRLPPAPGGGNRPPGSSSSPPTGTPQSSPPPGVITYEPPVAIVKTKPAFPPSMSVLLLKRTVVEVKVTIDKTGKVTKAEAVPQASVNSYWLNLAADAARFWRFKPAQRNHEPVPSEAVLQFVFTP